MEEREIKKIIQSEINNHSNDSQFSVASVGYHAHTGVDSPQVDGNDLVFAKQEFDLMSTPLIFYDRDSSTDGRQPTTVALIQNGDPTTLDFRFEANPPSTFSYGGVLTIGGAGIHRWGQIQLNAVDEVDITATDIYLNGTVHGARISKRVLALSANSATPAINTNLYDVVHITNQTAAITSFTTNLTGTPVDGDTLRISVTGTGAVGLTFGASFEPSGGTPLSTTTVGTTRLDMGFFWNTETSKWRQMAAS